MSNLCYWCYSDECFEVLVEFSVDGISYKPLSGSLRVTEVDNLLESSHRQNVLKICRYIKFSHLVEGEVPEFLVFHCISHMLVGVYSSSAVCYPDIIATVD